MKYMLRVSNDNFPSSLDFTAVCADVENKNVMLIGEVSGKFPLIVAIKDNKIVESKVLIDGETREQTFVDYGGDDVFVIYGEKQTFDFNVMCNGNTYKAQSSAEGNVKITSEVIKVRPCLANYRGKMLCALK